MEVSHPPQFSVWYSQCSDISISLPSEHLPSNILHDPSNCLIQHQVENPLEITFTGKVDVSQKDSIHMLQSQIGV